MSNSAFNQGQTGNASETAAGVVEQATPAQVAAKTDVGETGAPLFVPPSLIPSGEDVSGFLAYENIAAGDAVGLSHYIPPLTTVPIFNGGGSVLTQALPKALKFRVHSEMTSIGAYLMSSSNLLARCSVRSGSPLGTVLATIDIQYTGANWGYGYIPVTGLLTVGQDYYLVVTLVSGTGDWARSTTAALVPASPALVTYSSSDGFVANSTTDGTAVKLWFDSTGTGESSLSHNQIFKSSALDINNRLGFIGFAKEAATAGASVKVNNGSVIDGFTGLTVGAHYFLSDTIGAISTTPGTIEFYVGTAISATTLYRRGGFMHGFVKLPAISTTIAFQQPGLVLAVGANSFTHYKRVISGAYGTSLNYSGIATATIPVLPGDAINVGSNANCIFFPSI